MTKTGPPFACSRTASVLIVILLLVFGVFSKAFSENAPQPGRAYLIPVSGEVSPQMAAFIKRSVGEIPLGEKPLIVFEMDTFGGRVDSALAIVETITGIREASTLAYVKTKAISAGALIALSCERLVMKRHTTIGDCAPITYSQDGPQMLGEKFQSPLRAQFRSLAKKNGYDENLAEAMVSADLEVFRLELDGNTLYLEATEYADLPEADKQRAANKKTVVRKGELLTMDDVEARDLGFSLASADDLADALAKAGHGSLETVTLEKKWTESFLGLMISLSPILMMIGLAAVYTEIKAPGFGAPGIVGIICLSLAFGSQYAVGMANYTELLIVVFGLVLLGFEVFVIPGFGIAGIAGFFFIAVGLVLSLQDFVLPKPSMPWQGDLMLKNVTMVLGSYVVAIIAGLLMFRYVLPRFSFAARGPYLTGTLSDSHADSMEVRRARVGDQGVAVSYLRPSGKMKIGGDLFDVITEAEFIESGTPVTITRIDGNRIIVARKEETP
ncbi:NfeD family protein [Desulfatiferula olefinivorans]